MCDVSRKCYILYVVILLQILIRHLARTRPPDLHHVFCRPAERVIGRRSRTSHRRREGPSSPERAYSGKAGICLLLLRSSRNPHA